MSKSRLVSAASKLTPYKPPTWTASLSTDKLNELVSLKKAYHSGELKSPMGTNPSQAALWRLAAKELSLTISLRSFCDWLVR